MANDLTVLSSVTGNVLIPQNSILTSSGFQSFSFSQASQQSVLLKTLNLLPGFSKLTPESKNFFINSILSIRDVDGSQYIDVNSPFHSMEIVNLLWKSYPGGDFDPSSALTDLLNLLNHIKLSGDHFIWSLPIMTEYESQQELNVKKEFASLEGVQIPRTDPITGEETLLKCNYCGSLWWTIPPTVMKRRADEALEKNANCRECSRPRKNI